jgi:hypothetical protein
MKYASYFCPVCGFDGLKEVPYDEHGAPSYEICPCCGFEFGFEEQGDRARFREDWLRKGAPWFCPDLKPAGWDLQKQLAGLKPDPKMRR